MQKRENNLIFFLTFFGLSLLFVFFGRSGVFNSIVYSFNKASLPLEVASVNVLSLKSLQNNVIKTLREENSMLRKKALEQRELTLENQALKDQFETTSPQSLDLLPAKIVGAPGFIPGVTLPEYLIIDKGLKNGVKNGDSVVVKNNIVGRVINAQSSFSKIELITSKNSSFAAEVINSDGANFPGIIKGKGNLEMALENVLLSAEIKKDNLVVTTGEKNEEGIGYPPGLIVGKITTIEKKSSDLFQRADIVSFVEFKNLDIVFVLK